MGYLLKTDISTAHMTFPQNHKCEFFTQINATKSNSYNSRNKTQVNATYFTIFAIFTCWSVPTLSDILVLSNQKLKKYVWTGKKSK